MEMKFSFPRRNCKVKFSFCNFNNLSSILVAPFPILLFSFSVFFFFVFASFLLFLSPPFPPFLLPVPLPYKRWNFLLRSFVFFSTDDTGLSESEGKAKLSVCKKPFWKIHALSCKNRTDKTVGSPVHKLLGNFSATLGSFGNFQLAEQLSVHRAASKH